jgi:hypothetical protein
MAGAAMAVLIAALRALEYKKKSTTVACIVIASGGVGTIGPSAFVYCASCILPTEWQQWIHSLNWAMYTVMGLVFGLAGWGSVTGLMLAYSKRLPGLIDEQFDRIPRVKKPGHGNGSIPVIALLIIPSCLVCCTSTTTTTQTQPSGKQTITVVKKEPSPAIMPLLGALVEPGYGAVVGIGSKLVGYVAGWMSSKPKTTATVP